MKFGFAKPKRNLRPVHVVVALALIAAADPAGAKDHRSVTETVAPRTAGEPLLAIVSLRSQRVTIYDTDGWIMRAPVSSGMSGRETPAGIFAVIQKDADHHSNLYDDASMPNMERLTWSGIALHGGPLPGHPASHGCVRMPYDFAEQLFGVTHLGMRVIVAPTDVAPVAIAHPLLAQLKPRVDSLAASRTDAAEQATRKADQARLAAGKAFREAAQAQPPVRVAQNLKDRAEEQVAVADAAIAAPISDEDKARAERDKAQAVARVAELQTQLDAARAALQPKLDALATLRQAAVAAETEQAAAVEAARQVARANEPVSVLISRKTGRLYVRQGFEPVFDSAVTIEDPDRPIGTHVFTALAKASGDAPMPWSVVSLESSRPHGIAAPKSGARVAAAGPVSDQVDPVATDTSAKSALDRIVIPPDVLERIAMAPRSSLIITDEGLSSETGKGTDFVVLMSGEPQGGIKMRKRPPETEVSYSGYYDRPMVRRSSFSAPSFFSSW